MGATSEATLHKLVDLQSQMATSRNVRAASPVGLPESSRHLSKAKGISSPAKIPQSSRQETVGRPASPTGLPRSSRQPSSARQASSSPQNVRKPLAGRSASPAEMPQPSRELMSGRPASGSIAEEANAAAAGVGVQPWAEELGGQIWRLGSALRRVVQVQLEQQQHLKKCFVARDRSPSPVPSGDNVPAAPSRPPPPSNAVVP